jgi:hypothetical protein
LRPTALERIAASEAGGVLIKPVEPARLRRMIDSLLAPRAAVVAAVAIERAAPSLL